jgi:hypothetical protein
LIVIHDRSGDNNILHRSLLERRIQAVSSIRCTSSQRSHRHRAAAWSRPVTLRLAAAGDAPALERLAALDSRRLPPGPHLVAERDGIAAALSLSTHELVADPFRRTAELCGSLRCHPGEARIHREGSAEVGLEPRPKLVLG